MALNMILDLLLNSAQFDSALDKSEKRIKGFAREAEKAGKIAGKISTGLNVANVAGLEKLTAGSKAAKAGIDGLTGAMLLLGTVPLPIAIGVAAAGALAAFAVNSNDAKEQTKALEAELVKLSKTAKQLELEDAWRRAGKAAEQVLLVEHELADARRNVGEAVGAEEQDAAFKRIEALERELKKWKELEGIAQGSIKKIAETAHTEGVKALESMARSMEQATLKTQEGAEAAAWHAITTGEMGAALAAGEPKAVELAATIMRLARAQDAAADSAENLRERQRLLQEAQRKQKDEQRADDEWLDVYKDWQAANNKAEEDYAKSLDRMSVYADQAARNMQSAFADFLFDPFKDGLKGMLRGFMDIIRRMIAEMAAAKIFGSTSEGGFGLGDVLTGLFAGGFAKGGTIPSGKFGLVGEHGPEFVSGPATITPMVYEPPLLPPVQRESVDRSVSFAPVYNINAAGADEGTVEKLRAMLEYHDARNVERLAKYARSGRIEA